MRYAYDYSKQPRCQGRESKSCIKYEEYGRLWERANKKDWNDLLEDGTTYADKVCKGCRWSPEVDDRAIPSLYVMYQIRNLQLIEIGIPFHKLSVEPWEYDDLLQIKCTIQELQNKEMQLKNKSRSK